MKKLNFKNNKLAIVSLVALLVVGIVGGTFAVFNQTLTAENKFTVGAYGTQIEEKFTPPEDWTPGTTTDKEVWVKNTGDIPVVVRVGYAETWVDADKKDLSLTFTDDSGKEQEAAIKNWTDPSDWVKGTDGFYYYIGIVNGGEQTKPLLDSVTFNPAANVAAAEVTSMQEQMADGTWKTVTKTTKKNAYGYDNATYTLKFTGSTVQADAEAIAAVWGDMTAMPAEFQALFVTN